MSNIEKRKLGKTGLEVSVLGFGGAEVGYRGGTKESVAAILNDALDAGLNVIDTAECYMTSEELIGQTVSKRRKDYYLFSKCGHSRGYEDPDWNDVKRLRDSLDRSLQRLKTDHLDVFQLHSCTAEVLRRGDVIDFMMRAKEAGKTRFIGYSGDNDDAFYAVETGAFDTLQTSISVADQSVLDKVLPAAVKRGLGIIAKRPLANVMWTQIDKPDAYYIDYWERFKKLQFEFQKRPVGQGVAEALRFTLSVPGVSVAIVGTQKPGRWQENARIVADGPLEPKTFNDLRNRWKETAPSKWVGQI
jgi:aryl-alcohol dehydrogenase-like predicted oxidoreductase